MSAVGSPCSPHRLPSYLAPQDQFGAGGRCGPLYWLTGNERCSFRGTCDTLRNLFSTLPSNVKYFWDDVLIMDMLKVLDSVARIKEFLVLQDSLR